MQTTLNSYFETLKSLALSAAVTDGDHVVVPLDEAIDWAIGIARRTHAAGNKIMFIGNGGSAGIASHLAIDFSKNGDMRAMAFNDGAALTCLANDLGYENVFAKQIDLHARAGDMLVAISSSGRSENILRAVDVAKSKNCSVMTLSGFSADNPLRGRGDRNFYVASSEYGFVEVSHLALCHAVLDLAMGWNGRS